MDADYNMTAPDVGEQGRFQDSIGIFPGRSIHLTYRAMVPKKIQTLLVIGHSIGVGSAVAPGVRRDVAQVDIAIVQTDLERQEVRIG